MRKAMGLLRVNPCKIPGTFFLPHSREHSESLANHDLLCMQKQPRRHGDTALEQMLLAVLLTSQRMENSRFASVRANPKCLFSVAVPQKVAFRFSRRVAVPPWLQLLYLGNLLVNPVRRSFPIRLKIINDIVNDDQFRCHFQRNYVHRIFLGLYKFRK